VEIFVFLESPVCNEFTSLWWEAWSFISIDDSPFLVGTIMLTLEVNILSFPLNGVLNIEGLVVVGIQKMFSLEFEVLPPS
jgi:hypothetical protein